MPRFPQMQFPPMQSAMRAMLPLAFVGAASLVVGGCLPQVAAMNCKKVRSDTLHVGTNHTCQFRYDHGDVARYVVIVTQPPRYGQATAKGKYLTYAARPGFSGEDLLKIKVERRGVGHVQWETLTVKVKVGSTV